MLGFCPDDMTTVPAVAVRFLARQLDVDPGILASYGVSAQTRTDHLAQVNSYLGFPSATLDDLERLEAAVPAEPIDSIWHRSPCAHQRFHVILLQRPPHPGAPSATKPTRRP